jgi:hypothetical protein
MLTALVAADTFVNEAPELVERKMPVSPASQMSPSLPCTALNFAVEGSPVAAVCVNVAPPSVLT